VAQVPLKYFKKVIRLVSVNRKNKLSLLIHFKTHMTSKERSQLIDAIGTRLQETFTTAQINSYFKKYKVSFDKQTAAFQQGSVSRNYSSFGAKGVFKISW